MLVLKGVAYTALPESKVKCYSEHGTIPKREKEQRIVPKEEERKKKIMPWNGFPQENLQQQNPDEEEEKWMKNTE